MSSTVEQLIKRSLRLINVPGRGARLSAPALSEALEALQEILNSNAVLDVFVPGTRKHFFSIPSQLSKYSYGRSPQALLRSDNFDNDPAPIKIFNANVRQGGSIIDNEQVSEYRFENVGAWVEAGTADITNNAAVLANIGSISQALNLQDGVTYTVRVVITVNAGSCDLVIQGDAVDVLSQVLDSSGVFEFDFAFVGVASSSISITTTLSTDDVSIDSVSIIERTKQRLELAETGTDTKIKIKTDLDQWAAISSKYVGGDPCALLYNRIYPIPEIWFDQRPSIGLIIVMEVQVNQLEISNLSDEIKLHNDALRWLRYELADAMAGEYSKSLSREQRTMKDEAWDLLDTGNSITGKIRADGGILGRRAGGRYYDINTGD